MAAKTWEMANSIETVNSVDEIFKYDRQQQQEILQAKPWLKELVTLLCLARVPVDNKILPVSFTMSVSS